MEPRGIFARKDAAKEALVTRRASECVLWSLLSAADRLVAKFNIGTPVILTRLYLLVESRSSDRADCINVFYLALAVGPEIADKFVSDVLGPAEPLESVSIENFLVSACLDAGMTTKCYPKLWPMFVSTPRSLRSGCSSMLEYQKRSKVDGRRYGGDRLILICHCRHGRRRYRYCTR